MTSPIPSPLAVQMHDVHYTPHGALILRGVNLEVPPGACVGIVGPNGAGKSTLLRLLAAVLPASAGAILLEGRALGAWSARTRAQHLAFVPQRTELNLPFRVEQVVAMGRTPYLRRWQQEDAVDQAIITEAMALTDTLHLAGRTVTSLSGGELQRVALARALAQQPRVLLLDEPTANLDLCHQFAVLALVQRCTQAGVTVLVTLHDLNLAAQYCSTLLVLKAGSIYAAGPPETVLTPQTLRAVFAVDMAFGVHPTTGAPYIVPLPVALPCLTALAEEPLATALRR
ncbi:MAG: heme ABC transporter ATP-binding protein [Candidatus Tectimicrobiota bacterium]